MATTHTIHTLMDEWDTAEQPIASSSGGWSRKKLTVRIRFDGNGNSVVRFVVTDHNQVTSYEKFDSAAEAYNRLP